MLQALEKFVAVKDQGDGSAFKVLLMFYYCYYYLFLNNNDNNDNKVDGIRGGVYVGRGGDSLGTKKVILADSLSIINNNNNDNIALAIRSENKNNNNNDNAVRES